MSLTRRKALDVRRDSEETFVLGDHSYTNSVLKTPKLVTEHTIFLFRADALMGVTPHFLTDSRVYAIRCCYNISMVRRAILTMSDDALSRMVDLRDPLA